MVSTVTGQDEIGGELAPPPPLGVHLRRVEDLGRSFHEGVGQVGGSPGRIALLERLAPGNLELERLQRDSQRPLLPVRGVGVGHLRGQESLARPDHQGASVLHRGPELEGDAGKLELLVDLGGQGSGFVGRQVPSHPAVDDPGPVRGGEVHPVGEVAVAEVHAGAHRLDDAAARMLASRVVAQDGEHGDVRLGSDARADGDDGPGPALRRKRVHERGSGGLQRGAVSQRRDGIVPQPIEADVEQSIHVLPYRYLTMSANSSGSRLAPPTNAPSISGCAMKSRMLPAFTLPPYWTRTASATSFE